MADDRTATGLTAIFDRLKSSHLFLVLAGLFLLDLVVPDPLPFFDEAVLGVLTLLAARWQLRRQPAPTAPKPPPKNVTPPR